jgi:transcriptional regulator GlxA family with amidase domain
MRNLPAHAESHLRAKLDVNTLAAFVAMSPRTFARQFEGNFGITPARWVRSLRMETARRHLDSRNLSLKEIARVTGFRDEQALRRAHVQQMKMNLKEYRKFYGVRE